MIISLVVQRMEVVQIKMMYGRKSNNLITQSKYTSG